MTDKKTYSFGWGVGIVPIFFGLLALVMTQDIYCAISVLLTGWVFNLTVLLSLIPVLGLVLQWALLNWLMNNFLPMLTISQNVYWMVNVMYLYSLLIGLITTIIVSIMLSPHINER